MKRLCGIAVALCGLAAQGGCFTDDVYYVRAYPSAVANTDWSAYIIDTNRAASKAIELLPCPYCGAKPERQGFGYYGFIDWKYLCASCGGLMTTSGRDEEAVKRQWNFKANEVLRGREAEGKRL